MKLITCKSKIFMSIKYHIWIIFVIRVVNTYHIYSLSLIMQNIILKGQDGQRELRKRNDTLHKTKHVRTFKDTRTMTKHIIVWIHVSLSPSL